MTRKYRIRNMVLVDGLLAIMLFGIVVAYVLIIINNMANSQRQKAWNLFWDIETFLLLDQVQDVSDLRRSFHTTHLIDGTPVEYICDFKNTKRILNLNETECGWVSRCSSTLEIYNIEQNKVLFEKDIVLILAHLTMET